MLNISHLTAKIFLPTAIFIELSSMIQSRINY